MNLLIKAKFPFEESLRALEISLAMSSGLTPAGSSAYSSNTMYVGDGTWDAQRNTFLLPNLVGLNFGTMRYNGKPHFCDSNLHVLIKSRHGQSICRATSISYSHPRSWCHRCNHLPLHRTSSDPYQTIWPKFTVIYESTHLATNPDGSPDHGCICFGLVCSRA